MFDQRVQQHFFETADLQYRAGEAIAKPIADAAEAIVAALTAGGKLMVGGIGRGLPIAQWLVLSLTGRFDRDRPGLAAMLIGGDAAALGGFAQAGDPAGALARAVETLGQPGDLLLLIVAGPASAGLRHAIQTAQGHDMSVIALTGDELGPLVDALGETDLLIQIPDPRPVRIGETQIVAVDALAAAIDLLLLGDQETT